MASDLGDIDENEGPVVKFRNITTNEIKKLPEPVVESSVVWNASVPDLPPSTIKSAASTLQLLRKHLPVLTAVLRIHYIREKLDEKPDKGSWTILCPRIELVLCHLSILLYHARRANGILPSPLVKRLNSAQKLVSRAAKLADRIFWNGPSNASYLEVYYELVPKALDTLTDLIGILDAERVEVTVVRSN